jgi:hypothetical protein
MVEGYETRNATMKRIYNSNGAVFIYVYIYESENLSALTAWQADNII